jgi:hypothetical protein
MPMSLHCLAVERMMPLLHPWVLALFLKRIRYKSTRIPGPTKGSIIAHLTKESCGTVAVFITRHHHVATNVENLLAAWPTSR